MKRTNAGYNLKGRTLQSLLKQSDEWHKRSSYSGGLQYWRPCGIEGYRFEKEEGDIVVEELISTKELMKEGRTMKHCVASYAYLCVKGRTAIYSFRRYTTEQMQETLATIEVNIAAQKIVQAKGKMNKPVSNEVRKCMELWAKKRQLSIGAYL
ncbi:PcfJ domain-containing protein [Longitalea arenae]|uniref:PcfJ domain-containing protein n=1 Tax=Longitalea arenae TaxID=2812558 RepID=UPI0019673620|nr:PcfJ domain-containing protein [Longitalea arenae]